ncbi:MAG: efflux RND transporter periplasmic adaptor subunit [Candidatus Eisenbacteria bacterium]|uniref:Efflux RND transporter periplasmic adaptor subunit n=1 Tax=Eiseniibacteriota bacterium TaxID=2212470 RepID=A0A956RMX8_UNCEI|nr:efflux RND transporter periplasmic adaptor subunit [Candidatus Eisenbacteria bacterium]
MMKRSIVQQFRHEVVRLDLLLPALASLSLFLLTACGHEPYYEAEGEPVAVRVHSVVSQDEPRPIEAVGTTVATQSATLAARVMGTVLEIRKNAGDLVHRGEVILVIDPREVSGQIAQAEGAVAQAKAALVLAETNLQRFERLFERGSASQLELDQARWQRDTAAGAVKQAEGAVATARSMKSYAEVAAPFDGRIVDRLCEVGDLATPGRPLLRVEDAAHMRVHLSLAEDRVGLLSEGVEVPVTIPALGDQSYRARVAQIVPAVDAASRSFTVKLDLPEDPTLRAGLFARASLPGELHPVVRAPESSVVRRGGLTGAFVDGGGKARFRLLVLSTDGSAPATGVDESVVVASGLAAGDRLILDPPSTLEEGSPIEVRS